MKYDYFFIQGLYTEDECRELRERIESLPDYGFPDAPAEGVVKTANVKCFMYGDVSNLLNKMRHRVLDINKHCFGLDLFETSEYEVLHYNSYSPESNGEYGWHKDGCKNESHDVKLTALINLSEEYQGGKFELFLNGPLEIPEFQKTGSFLLFPSWITHRVTPVTAGKRITLSQFYAGPNFK
jgi:predicted 2-oxoglutarate/Fe(II)-dependent dioxygenase YbiX